MTTIEQLLNPIADALHIDLDFIHGLLYAEGEVDFELIKGIPTMTKFQIVDSVVDDHYDTVGVIAKIGGNLYLAMINDDRVMKLTFFAVDGKRAGFHEKFQKNGRLGILDGLNGHWSRKKFYSLIAPGVKATFVRPSVSNEWERESVGCEAAMKYLAMRQKKEQSKSKSASDWNKEFDSQRRLGLPTWK